MSPVSIANFTICRTCAGLSGYPDGRDQYPQVCRCRREGQERWPDHDFNEYIDLCWCCLLNRIPSGSKMSPFFCPACLARAEHQNHAAGRVVLYVGRHSVMNGIWLEAADAARPEAVEAFGQALAGFTVGIMRFHEAMETWRPQRLQMLLQAIGRGTPAEGEGPELGLIDYLRATRGLDEHPVYGKQAAFRAMVGFLDDRLAQERR